jgi:hypothetical protein
MPPIGHLLLLDILSRDDAWQNGQGRGWLAQGRGQLAQEGPSMAGLMKRV